MLVSAWPQASGARVLPGQATAGTRKLLCLKFRAGLEFAQESAN